MAPVAAAAEVEVVVTAHDDIKCVMFLASVLRRGEEVSRGVVRKAAGYFEAVV